MPINAVALHTTATRIQKQISHMTAGLPETSMVPCFSDGWISTDSELRGWCIASASMWLM
jgi:hypothetical protein